MPSLCCFWCPASDLRNRVAGEVCPTCGRPYEAPIQYPPKRIGRFIVEKAISRGFYGAAYRARQESLGRLVVLKVVPVAVYEFFRKDWKRECEEHAAIAEGTPFVANITEQFDEDGVEISGSFVRCHVAVLENIEGPTLEQVLAEPEMHQLTARVAAQIAADLFEILHLFIQQKRYHNDLHAANIIIQQLSPQMLRSGSIEPSVRAVAIDLGSVRDADRSGEHAALVGDQHHVARHLWSLAASLQNGRNSDIEYRIAGTLRGLAEHLAPESTAQRIMTVDDALEALRSAMSGVDEPWRQPLSLHRFGDAYNAQAIEFWHVPELWFDPDNKWLTRTTARGPQVITGMRGCGKTMLLRALHLHARAAQASKNTDSASALERLQKDDFLGVYASCQKLLDPQQHEGIKNGGGPKSPFERLYVAYLRDAIQVLRHLRSISSTALLGNINVLLRESLQPLELPSRLSIPTDERGFEQLLLDLQFELSKGSTECALRTAPAEAFGHLAEVIRSAAPVLRGKYVLFLLDDVSTRYLHPDTVREVISQLLFQHPSCAFRITTEAQALQRVLLSPGGSEAADPRRDYDEFDLGNEVYRLLKEGSTHENIEFVSEILRRRGRQFQDELYRREPIELLGDVSLEQIASEIADSSASSPARKRVYRGLRALQAVCVGDLGDVVKLYEKILRRANANQRTVPEEAQCDCFLEHSAGLMHFLNRRDGHKKGLALAFAQAAGELLKRSAKNGGTRRRLRQYTKLYVRVDAGPDFENVATQLLSLLDAGVFVYDGGVPRTKIRDDDPVLQFKLSYRKLLGLASFIGLSDRDRFELSGDNLREWLRSPEKAKDILVESEAKTRGSARVDMAAEKPESNDTIGPRVELHTQLVHERTDKAKAGGESSVVLPRQLRLNPAVEDVPRPLRGYAPKLGTSARPLSITALASRDIDVLILALGFEERTRVSAERLLGAFRPRRILLIEYTNGQGEAIAALIKRTAIPTDRIATTDPIATALGSTPGDIVIDSSGLSKPFLFVATRESLLQRRRVTVVHTLAKEYYPRNEDLRAHGITNTSEYSEIFTRLENVLMGEAPPYQLIQVHEQPAEPQRWRALLASASAKNDRLLHLLDARTYDAARILVPPPLSARQRVARAAAELAASAAGSNVGLIEVETNDIEHALAASERVYNDLYFQSGANVEIGLTGSKMHAVAFAVLAAAARISSAWYVAPRFFDEQRFTVGTRDTRCFELALTGPSDS